MDLKTLERNYTPIQTKQAATPQPKKAPGGGFLTSFLPTILGGAGAAVGTVAGPLGTAAGGALGSGLGEFLRQKVSGEDTSLGTIGREAAFGSLPGVFKGAKALKAGKGIKGLVQAEKAAKTAKAVQAVESPVMNGVDNIVGAASNAAKSGTRIPVKFADDVGYAIPKKAFTKEVPTILKNPTVGELQDIAASGKQAAIKDKFGTPFVKTTKTTKQIPVNTATGKQMFEQDIPTKTPAPASAPVTPVATPASAPTMGGADLAEQGLADKASRSLRHNAIAPGKVVLGQKRVPEKGYRDMASHLDSVGGVGSDAEKLARVEDDLAERGARIKESVRKQNRMLTQDDQKSVLSGIVSKKPFGYQKALEGDVITDLTKRISAASNLEDYQALKGDIDGFLLNAYNREARDATQTAEEILMRNARKSINKIIGESVDGYKDLNKGYQLGLDSQVLLGKRANPSGIRVLGLQTDVGGRAVQKAQDLIGRGIEKVGDLVSPADSAASTVNGTPGFRPFIGATVKQGAARVAGSGVFGTPFVGQSGVVDEAPLEEPTTNLTSPEMSTSPTITRESLASAIAADPKNASTYMKMYEMFGDTGGSGGNLSDSAIATISDLQSGMSQLRDLAARIRETNAIGPGVGQLRSLNPFDDESKDVRGQLDLVRQIVGKALEGGVLRKEDEKKYERILPTVGQTPEQAANNIENVMRGLETKMNEYVQLQQQFGKNQGNLGALLSGAGV